MKRPTTRPTLRIAPRESKRSATTPTAPAPPTDAAPVAVCYVRVSTTWQAEHGTSLDSQREACLKMAASIGARVLAVHADEGLSGALYATRAGLQAVLSAVETGRANRVIGWKLDRFARDVDVLRDVYKRILKAGATIVFADGLIIKPDSTGFLMLTQLGAFGEYEKSLIRDRMLGGRRKRVEEGQQVARAQSPFGYRIPTKADVIAGRYPAEQLGQYVIIEEEAVWVRFLFEQYANGWTLYRLMNHLQAAGVPTPRGGAWTAATLSRMMQRTAYAGRPTFGKMERFTDETRAERGLKIHFYKPAPADRVIELSCPPLVSEETFAAVQERFAFNSEVLSGRPDRRWLLTGLISCPACGRKMTAQKRSRVQGKASYHCKFHAPSCSSDGFVCYPHRLLSEQAEGAVIDAIADLATFPAALKEAYSVLRDADADPDAGAGEKERAEVEAAFAALTAREQTTIRTQISAMQAGASPDSFAPVFGEIAAERERLTARRAALTRSTEPVADRAALLAEAKAIAGAAGETVRELLTASELTVAERHEILTQLIRGSVPHVPGQEAGKPDESGAYPTPTHLRVTFHGVGLTVLTICVSSE